MIPRLCYCILYLAELKRREKERNMASPGFWSFPSKVVCLFLIESFSWKPWHQKRKRPHPLESCLPVSKTKHFCCCCCLAFFFFFSPSCQKFPPDLKFRETASPLFVVNFRPCVSQRHFHSHFFRRLHFFVAKKNRNIFEIVSSDWNFGCPSFLVRYLHDLLRDPVS